MESKDDFDKINYIIEHLHSPEKLLEGEFQDWLKQDDNLSLFREIRINREAWLHKESANQVDVHLEFKKFRANLLRKKRQTYHWIGAAACCILLIAGAWLQNISDSVGPDAIQKPVIQELAIAKRKAELVLPDGQRVILENQVAEFNNSKGVVVKNDSAARLVYENTQMHPDQGAYHIFNVPAMADYCIVLNDGTKVWLNCESSLKYPEWFNKNERRVHLSGEAYFEVKKASDWPFVVIIDEMNVEVTGTSFNISAYPKEKTIQTTLVQGEVLANNRLLKPNQQLTFNKETKRSELKEVDVLLYTAWVKGLFVFKNERLETVMDKLSRWYGVDVVYLQSSAKDLRFSGSLKRYGRVDEIVDVIYATNKINIKLNGNVITISDDL